MFDERLLLANDNDSKSAMTKNHESDDDAEIQVMKIEGIFLYKEAEERNDIDNEEDDDRDRFDENKKEIERKNEKRTTATSKDLDNAVQEDDGICDAYVHFFVSIFDLSDILILTSSKSTEIPLDIGSNSFVETIDENNLRGKGNVDDDNIQRFVLFIVIFIRNHCFQKTKGKLSSSCLVVKTLENSTNIFGDSSKRWYNYCMSLLRLCLF